MASFTERYHEFTKYNPQTIDKLGPVFWSQQPLPFKEIQSNEKIVLTQPLEKIFEKLQPAAIAPLEKPTWPGGLEGLAELLHFTLGITGKMETEGGPDFFFRAAPSAGGLYPTEIYVALRRQENISDGFYHYHSKKNALIPVWQGDFWAELQHYFLQHPAVAECDCIILFTGIYGRSAWRYKERAYRRILLDTGHALGNLLEICEYEGLPFSLLASFMDQGLEELLFLTAKEEMPLLAVAIGKLGQVLAAQGQRPSAEPEAAAKLVQSEDPMQVQQNCCERIDSVTPARPIVSDFQHFPPFEIGNYNALRGILTRRSCRQFNGQAISTYQLKEILGFAFRNIENCPWALAPGHWQAHLVALRVDGLQPGVYQVDTEAIDWNLTKPGNFKSECFYMCLGQELSSDCAFALVYTADLAKLAETYGDRGYRYVCLDAGQVGERINLMADHLHLGSSGIGGYFDDQANELLKLPLSHAVIYITLVGVPDNR